MQDYRFAKLTPERDIDIKVYEEAINFALNEDDIRNVAISGAYGAGKSSVLETYKERNPGTRFLNISLARFENEVSDEEKKKASADNEKHTVSEAKLEAKIINQLIHWISPKKIPLTNFKIKRSVKLSWVIFAVLLIALFVVGIFYQNNFWGWRRVVIHLPAGCLKNCLLKTVTPSARVIYAALTLVVGTIIGICLVWLQVQGRLVRKLSIKGSDIEFNDKTVDSYFDRHLDEVLYLFQHADVEVIVFEDLDRYNANQIFGRLREVNTLVNSSILRDKGKKGAKTSNKKDEKTKKQNQDCENKNTRPIKFFYLLRDDVFTSKDRTKFFDFIIPIVPVVDGSNSFDQLLKLLRQQNSLTGISEEVLQDIALYIDDMRVLKNICNELIIYRDRVDSTELDSTKMLALIVYKNLFPRDYSLLQLKKGYVYQLFEKKKELIVEETAKLRSNTTEQEKSVIEGKTLQELITRNNRSSVFNLNNVNMPDNQRKECNDVIHNDYFDLLVYLIGNGYIDETYPDYMTYFYGESLYQEDKVFLRSITDRKAKPYDYALKDSKKVFNRIHIRNADQIECLNNNLFDHAVEHHTTDEKTMRLFQMLKQNSSYEFIRQYLSISEKVSNFIFVLNIVWPEFFSLVHKNGWLDTEYLKLYSVETLLHSDLTVIKKINIENCLSKFISGTPDYLSIDCEDVEKLIAGLKNIGVKFKQIDSLGMNEELYRRVYEESLYEITEKTLELAIQRDYEEIDHDSILHKNLSIIRSRPDSPLCQYVMNSFGTYMSVYLSMCKKEIWDDESIACIVLNAKDIASAEKSSYLSALQTKISSLADITDRSIWPCVLENGVLKFSEKNALNYYQVKNAVDTFLCKYINDADKTINYNALQGVSTKEQNKALFVALIKCKDIQLNRIQEIIESAEEVYFDTSVVSGIPEEHMILLVSSKVFPMNRNVLTQVRSAYSKGVVDEFIKAKFSAYVSIMDNTLIRLDEIVRTLEWSGEEEEKLKLLKRTSSSIPISISGKDYADPIMEYILSSRFNTNELEVLLKDYSRYSVFIRKCIIKRVVQHYTSVLAKINIIDQQLILDLLQYDDLELVKKQEIILKALQYVEKEKAIIFFDAIGIRELSKILANEGRPKIPYEDFYGKALEQMKKREWIENYFQSPTDAGVYKVDRKHQKKK